MGEYKDERSKLMQDPKFAIESAKGDLIMDATETICEILEENNIERKELAGRMGKTKGYISQLLNGGRNMTLNTLAEMAYHLGYKANLKFEKIEKIEKIQSCTIDKFPYTPSEVNWQLKEVA